MDAVVVNWNGEALLPACLRSLRAQNAAAQLSIWVVDNGSSDGSLALLARDYSDVRVIAAQKNLGFGAANNLAIGQILARGTDFVALINNDVELDEGWLAALLDAAHRQPGAALLTGTLLFQDGSGINSTGLVFDRLGRAIDRDFGRQGQTSPREAGSVEGASGGALLLRASALEQVGAFDPGYFAYYEDAELSLRMRRAGFCVWHEPAAVARHAFSKTFGRDSPLKRELLGRGHLRTLALHQPWVRLLWLLPFAAGYRVALRAPWELLRGRPRHAWAELRAGLAGGFGAAGAAWKRARQSSGSRRPRTQSPSSAGRSGDSG